MRMSSSKSSFPGTPVLLRPDDRRFYGDPPGADARSSSWTVKADAPPGGRRGGVQRRAPQRRRSAGWRPARPRNFRDSSTIVSAERLGRLPVDGTLDLRGLMPLTDIPGLDNYGTGRCSRLERTGARRPGRPVHGPRRARPPARHPYDYLRYGRRADSAAADDPDVLAISDAVRRRRLHHHRRSPARGNTGEQVTVLVELTARFDRSATSDGRAPSGSRRHACVRRSRIQRPTREISGS